MGRGTHLGVQYIGWTGRRRPRGGAVALMEHATVIFAKCRIVSRIGNVSSVRYNFKLVKVQDSVNISYLQMLC